MLDVTMIFWLLIARKSKTTLISALELGQKFPLITVTKQTVNKYLFISHDLAMLGPNTLLSNAQTIITRSQDSCLCPS